MKRSPSSERRRRSRSLKRRRHRDTRESTNQLRYREHEDRRGRRERSSSPYSGRRSRRHDRLEPRNSNHLISQSQRSSPHHSSSKDRRYSKRNHSSNYSQPIHEDKRGHRYRTMSRPSYREHRNYEVKLADYSPRRTREVRYDRHDDVKVVYEKIVTPQPWHNDCQTDFYKNIKENKRNASNTTATIPQQDIRKTYMQNTTANNFGYRHLGPATDGSYEGMVGYGHRSTEMPMVPSLQNDSLGSSRLSECSDVTTFESAQISTDALRGCTPYQNIGTPYPILPGPPIPDSAYAVPGIYSNLMQLQSNFADAHTSGHHRCSSFPGHATNLTPLSLHFMNPFSGGIEAGKNSYFHMNQPPLLSNTGYHHQSLDTDFFSGISSSQYENFVTNDNNPHYDSNFHFSGVHRHNAAMSTCNSSVSNNTRSNSLSSASGVSHHRIISTAETTDSISETSNSTTGIFKTETDSTNGESSFINSLKTNTKNTVPDLGLIKFEVLSDDEHNEVETKVFGVPFDDGSNTISTSGKDSDDSSDSSPESGSTSRDGFDSAILKELSLPNILRDMEKLHRCNKEQEMQLGSRDDAQEIGNSLDNENNQNIYPGSHKKTPILDYGSKNKTRSDLGLLDIKNSQLNLMTNDDVMNATSGFTSRVKTSPFMDHAENKTDLRSHLNRTENPLVDYDDSEDNDQESLQSDSAENDRRGYANSYLESIGSSPLVTLDDNEEKCKVSDLVGMENTPSGDKGDDFLKNIKQEVNYESENENQNEDWIFSNGSMPQIPFHGSENDIASSAENNAETFNSNLHSDVVRSFKISKKNDKSLKMAASESRNRKPEARNNQQRAWIKPLNIDLSEFHNASLLANTKREPDVSPGSFVATDFGATSSSINQMTQPHSSNGIQGDPRLRLRKYRNHVAALEKGSFVSSNRQLHDIKYPISTADINNEVGLDNDFTSNLNINGRRHLVCKVETNDNSNRRQPEKPPLRVDPQIKSIVPEKFCHKPRMEFELKPTQFARSSTSTRSFEELQKRYPMAVSIQGSEWVQDLLSIDEKDLEEKERRIRENPDSLIPGTADVIRESKEFREYSKRRTQLYRESLQGKPKRKSVFTMKLPLLDN